MAFKMIQQEQRTVTADVALSIRESDPSVLTIRVSGDTGKAWGVKGGQFIAVGIDMDTRELLLLEDARGQRKARVDGKRTLVDLLRKNEIMDLFPSCFPSTAAKVSEVSAGRLVIKLPKI